MLKAFGPRTHRAGKRPSSSLTAFPEDYHQVGSDGAESVDKIGSNPKCGINDETGGLAFRRCDMSGALVPAFCA